MAFCAVSESPLCPDSWWLHNYYICVHSHTMPKSTLNISRRRRVGESIITMRGPTTSSPISSLLVKARGSQRPWSSFPSRQKKVVPHPALYSTGHLALSTQGTSTSPLSCPSSCPAPMSLQSQTRDARLGQLWQFLDDIRPENE